MKKLLSLLPLLIPLSVYADQASSPPPAPLYRGDQPLDPQIPAAYNFPSAIQLHNSWHLFANASYLYWFSGEEGLDLATTASYTPIGNAVIASPEGGKTIFQDFEYASGFKVGIGATVCSDNWIIRADYTRLHQRTKKSASAPNSDIGVGALYLTDWFFQVSSQNQGIAASALTSSWHLELDWLDVVMTRPFYSGRKLILNPFIGLRSSWIEQSLHIDALGALNINPPTNNVHSRNHQESWGIGPRAGIEGRLLLGAGMRIQGEIGASLLYTRFSHVSHTEDSFTPAGFDVSFSMRDKDCVRPMAEASLGLGWGTYLGKQRLHWDIRATYDFNYLWAQNMMRALNDLQMIGTGGAAGDLYLHGLTVTTCVNF